MSRFNFGFVFLWYLLPFLYLLLVEGIFLSQTSIILSIFLLGLTIGYFSLSRVNVELNLSFSKVADPVFKLIYVLTIMVMAYGFFRVLNDGFDLASYRMEYYESTGGVFKSTYLFTLYTVFLRPLFLLGIMRLLTKNLKNKSNRRLLFFLFFILVLDGILSLGRFPYLFVLFFIFIGFKSLGLKRAVFFFGIAIIVVFSFATVYFRQFFADSAVGSITDIVNSDVARSSAVSYQYNGYVFLESLIADKSPLGHPWELNTASFGFLFSKIVSTKFGIDFNYSWEHYNLQLTEGIYHSKLNLLINAFATNFFPIYLDFGYLGIFIFALISGAFLGLRSSNRLIKSFQILNMFILVFGLYQPIITSLLGFILLIGYVVFILYMIKNIVNYLQLVNHK